MQSGSPLKTEIKCLVGTGQLNIGKHSADYNAIVSQLVDGNIQAECQVTSPLENIDQSLVNFDEAMPSQLDVTTPEGLSIHLSGMKWFQVHTFGSSFQWYAIYSWLDVVSNKNNKVTSACYHLTNLEFMGDEPCAIQVAPRTTYHTTQLRLTLGKHKVVLRPVPASREILSVIKRERSVGTTATATIDIEKIEDILAAKQAIEDLCLLVSFARGCRITAINCDVIDEQNDSVRFTAQSIPIKKYGLMRIPEVEPLHAQTTKRFIETAYQHLDDAKQLWSIDKAIEYYLDAKREGDEFEFWGLKMAVCMEFLRNQYLKSNRDEQHILPKRKFKKAIDSVRNNLEEALCSIGGATIDQTEMIFKCTTELNRKPFYDTLIKMNKAVNARISEIETRHFKNIRDNVVHTGAYSEKLGSPLEQYCFLEKYVQRFILAALGQPVDAVWDGYCWQSDGTPVIDTLKWKNL